MKINWDYSIIGGALVVSAPRYMESFIMANGVTLPAAWYIGSGLIQGLGMAVLLEGGAWFVFRAWAKASGKRFALLTAFLVALLVLAPVIQSPPIAANLQGETLAGVLQGWTWAWSFIVAASPFVLVGAVAYGHRDAPKERQETATVTTDDVTMTRQQARTSRLDAIRNANVARNGDGPMTAAEIVAMYGVSLRQAQRDVAEVATNQNGHGQG